MKKLLLYGALLICSGAGAQSLKSSVVSNKGQTAADGASGSINSTGNYKAKADAPDLRIYDPTIRAMNNKTEYGGVKLFGNNSLLALPKGTYIYKGGQFLLRSTGATSIGGITGNSSVGTGSSGAGVGGNMIGVNGKNPHAGQSMWGSAQGLNLPDSLLRRNPATSPKP